jgi:DNA repair protein RadC
MNRTPIRVPTGWGTGLFFPLFQIISNFRGLVHNHPSGDPAPSSADVEITRQIIEAGRALRIAVHDHLVVGRDGVASFKALGLI